MVGELLVVEERVVPDDLAFPRELLDPAQGPGAAAERLLAAPQVAGPQQVPIGQQVAAVMGVRLGLPGMHHPGLVVEQIDALRVHRGQERVARECLGTAQGQPELHLGRGLRRAALRLAGGILGRGDLDTRREADDGRECQRQ